jgi:preprotein translocase subunit SecF
MIVAGVCIVVAAFFMLRGDLNTAFVVATLGIVAWFLNYRIQMKAIVTAADIEESRREEIEDGEDSDEN